MGRYPRRIRYIRNRILVLPGPLVGIGTQLEMGVAVTLDSEGLEAWEEPILEADEVMERAPVTTLLKLFGVEDTDSAIEDDGTRETAPVATLVELLGEDPERESNVDSSTD
jgi:hypothetical protein